MESLDETGKSISSKMGFFKYVGEKTINLTVLNKKGLK